MPRSGPCCLLELSLSRQAARNAADGGLIFCFRFMFNFLRFCQTNYLNISRTDLHQICRVAAVDERSEVSFSLFVKLVDQLTIINRRLGGEYNSYRLCPASSFLLFSPLLSLLRFPSPPTPHIPCSFFTIVILDVVLVFLSLLLILAPTTDASWSARKSHISAFVCGTCAAGLGDARVSVPALVGQGRGRRRH